MNPIKDALTKLGEVISLLKLLLLALGNVESELKRTNNELAEIKRLLSDK